MSSEQTSRSKKTLSSRVPRTVRELVGADGALHPALLPGIAVDENSRRFRIDWWVSGAALVAVVALVLVGAFDSEALGHAAGVAVHWVSIHTGWLFTLLTIAVFIFMLVVGYSAKGNIVLGTDDEEPEFSRGSWVAMLFSAGMGIGLLFFGPYEPLHFFLNVPPASTVDAGTPEAMQAAIAQTLLHWGPMAWSYYALVGGAIAYSAYRRGRSPLISAIFTPIFSEKLAIPFGRVIDTFAILVTLFGTAVSLGLGALQIGKGVEIVAGIGPLGNGVIIGLMVALTIAFILSAVSGVKRGIRMLSNINMMLALGLGLFVFLAGPTLFLLDFIPTAVVAFVTELGPMLAVSASASPEAADFMESWTTYYWAWWVSWTPFVGMFIARISRGRTLREFVTVVIVIPSLVSLLWFSTLGGTSMWMEQNGANISAAGSSQEYLFSVLSNLPFATITAIIAMFALVIFFVTSADSASLVMATISQRGKSNPSKRLTAVWGVALSATAITLLITGGEDTVSALQALVTISALPFAIILILMMVAWWKDLSTDPLVLRRKYASVAIDEGVRKGIQQHGDSFAFSAGVTHPDRGAGSWLDRDDESLTGWYEEVVLDNNVTEMEAELEAELETEDVEEEPVTTGAPTGDTGV
ncbi:BCCT family transporter [Actinomyces minihominis]|uniref:BCCT family transporter n=1 Tax=Actinomyces minihominis TaxID=2002838 RepID=UPI000C06E3AA|nr:BCCT family transporter [Actinomyces minihominis]